MRFKSGLLHANSKVILEGPALYVGPGLAYQNIGVLILGQ